MNPKTYNTKYCKITHLKNKDAILCQWKQKCSGDNYKNPLIFALKLLKETKSTTWITDTTNGFENEPEDTNWLLEKFLPQTIQSSCDTIVFIIQNDSLLKEEITNQALALKQYFKVVLVSNIDEIQ